LLQKYNYFCIYGQIDPIILLFESEMMFFSHFLRHWHSFFDHKSPIKGHQEYFFAKN